MTPSQQAETRRFTHQMWTLMWYAGRMHPSPAAVVGHVLRTARILERRGFLSVMPDGRDYAVRLTEVGHEALAADRTR